jgi:hypothetical protein
LARKIRLIGVTESGNILKKPPSEAYRQIVDRAVARVGKA